MASYRQSRNKIRISILLPNLRGGGAERVNIDLAREFARLGNEVEFVLMRTVGDFMEEVKTDFSIIDLGTAQARHVPLSFARYLRARQPDAVIANMWPLTVAAPIAARLAGYRGRTIVAEHGILSAQYATWGKTHRMALRGSTAIGYRLADARIGVSRGVAADMAKISGLPIERFTVIHNPVRSLPQPSASQLSTVEYLWGSYGPRIVSVGSLKPVKNHSLLLRAFAKVIKCQPEAQLLLLGQGKNEAMLRSLAAELDISERVIFAGFHKDPTLFYHTADLFVLSSDYEGFGNVIVEALSCSLPVVSTDCPSGPLEILEGGRHGRLVPVGDAEALAKAISESLSAGHDSEALRSRAGEFSVEKIGKRYLEVLIP